MASHYEVGGSQRRQHVQDFERKESAFASTDLQGKHTARDGIANFRVITVTPTKQRALNLCQKLKDAGLASKRFWFTDLGQIGAEEILEKIFWTPRDFEEGLAYGFRDERPSLTGAEHRETLSGTERRSDQG